MAPWEAPAGGTRARTAAEGRRNYRSAGLPISTAWCVQPETARVPRERRDQGQEKHRAAARGDERPTAHTGATGLSSIRRGAPHWDGRCPLRRVGAGDMALDNRWQATT